jgi:hypothetical protein
LPFFLLACGSFHLIEMLYVDHLHYQKLQIV